MRSGKQPLQLTDLNNDLMGQREMSRVERMVWPSSHDGLEIEGWVMKPPGFDPEKQYPMILEIHGGPHSAYGPNYSTEAQLFAAAGYVVFYTNPGAARAMARSSRMKSTWPTPAMTTMT